MDPGADDGEEAAMGAPRTAHVLVVANRTVATPRLLEAVRRRAALGACDFTLLVPAGGGRTDWTIDAALPLVQRAAGGRVEALAAGADTFATIARAVGAGEVDEIIISTARSRASKALRRDLVRRVGRLPVPVTAVMPRKAGDTSVDATLEAGMGALGRAMSAGQSWAPKDASVPRIGDERPRGE